MAIAVDKGAADVSLIPKVGVRRYHQEFGKPWHDSRRIVKAKVYVICQKAEGDNTNQDLDNSGYKVKTKFNNYCFIMHIDVLIASVNKRACTGN